MRFYIESLGCPKNTVDSEMMAELLRSAGHVPVAQPRQADVLIVNTCGFIQVARDESYEALRALTARKRRGQKVVAAGCLAQHYGDEIRRFVPGVDALIGTRNWHEIAQLVQSLASGQQSLLDGVRVGGNLVASTRRQAALGGTAYIKIADGCDASCAFCAIPIIKGPQRSKPLEMVLREARELASQGVRELVLIAQDTTAYGRDLGLRDGLTMLLHALTAEIPQSPWLRILYAYPQHITPALIETIAATPQVCHYLDLPLQHGHPNVLQRMRRPHDLQQVYDLVAALRAAMPDIALRSTFIVGYPGETDAEFEGLLDLMEAVAFDKVGVFGYSAEEGTEAASLPGRVAAEVIAERHERAMLFQQGISLARNQAQVGRELKVLIDGAGDGLSVGRSYRDAPEIDGMVLLPSELPVGEFVTARIVAGREYDLVGEVIEPPRP
jgi:ribosomal protein S12 methylthiotransferase